jgi:hypothetical protein
MSSAMTRPAGASGTANPVVVASGTSVAAPCSGVGVALIDGNSPDALPGLTALLVDPPSSLAPPSDGSGIGGSVGPPPAVPPPPAEPLAPPEPLAPAEPLPLPFPAVGAVVGVRPGGVVDVAAAGDVLDGAGSVMVFDGVGDGEGVLTVTADPADGGVHGSSVGTLAVAVSDTEPAPAGAATCACISTLDGEPSRFIDAIQHDAVPSPSGHPDVYVAPPAGVLSATVTSAVSPFSTETSTANAAVPPGSTWATAGVTVTHRSATVSPCNCTH